LLLARFRCEIGGGDSAGDGGTEKKVGMGMGVAMARRVGEERKTESAVRTAMERSGGRVVEREGRDGRRMECERERRHRRMVPADGTVRFNLVVVVVLTAYQC
jgi:hypothetical protein